MIETLFHILSSQALGNLILLIAAFVGVGGNYWIYLKKRKKKREKLRQSLIAEISCMRDVVHSMKRQSDVVTMDPLDPRSFLVDSVYQASSDDLGLLTDEEVRAVVEFYTTAISIQRVIGDDFHTAYDQVDRRDLLEKLDTATLELEMKLDSEEDEFGSTAPTQESQ